MIHLCAQLNVKLCSLVILNFLSIPKTQNPKSYVEDFKNQSKDIIVMAILFYICTETKFKSGPTFPHLLDCQMCNINKSIVLYFNLCLKSNVG